jgi:hypothetical protein
VNAKNISGIKTVAYLHPLPIQLDIGLVDLGCPDIVADRAVGNFVGKVVGKAAGRVVDRVVGRVVDIGRNNG